MLIFIGTCLGVLIEALSQQMNIILLLCVACCVLLCVWHYGNRLSLFAHHLADPGSQPEWLSGCRCYYCVYALLTWSIITPIPIGWKRQISAAEGSVYVGLAENTNKAHRPIHGLCHFESESRALCALSCLDISGEGKGNGTYGFGATFTMSSSTSLLIHHLKLLCPLNWMRLEQHFRRRKLFLWWCRHKSLCRCITEMEDSIDFIFNCVACGFFSWWERFTVLQWYIQTSYLFYYSIYRIIIVT